MSKPTTKATQAIQSKVDVTNGAGRHREAFTDRWPAKQPQETLKLVSCFAAPPARFELATTGFEVHYSVH